MCLKASPPGPACCSSRTSAASPDRCASTRSSIWARNTGSRGQSGIQHLEAGQQAQLRLLQGAAPQPFYGCKRGHRMLPPANRARQECDRSSQQCANP